MGERNAAGADVRHVRKAAHGFFFVFAHPAPDQKIDGEKGGDAADKPPVKGRARVGGKFEYPRLHEIVKRLEQDGKSVADDDRGERGKDDDALQSDGKSPLPGHAVGEQKRRHDADENKDVVKGENGFGIHSFPPYSARGGNHAIYYTAKRAVCQRRALPFVGSVRKSFPPEPLPSLYFVIRNSVLVR